MQLLELQDTPSQKPKEQLLELVKPYRAEQKGQVTLLFQACDRFITARDR